LHGKSFSQLPSKIAGEASMNTRKIISSLGILVLAFFLAGARSDATAQSFCSRHAVTFFPLAAELTKVYKCNQAVCAGNTVDSETKQIAGYINPAQWLVTTTNPNAPYSISQQNAIIQSANTKANAMRPAGKMISSMQFFWDMIVPINTPSYFIGANVTYARCLKGSGPAR
jgi:hypothetical protein